MFAVKKLRNVYGKIFFFVFTHILNHSVRIIFIPTSPLKVATHMFKISSVLIVLLVSLIACAGDTQRNYVSIAEYNSQRCFTTNSIPDHSAGPFRNGTVVKPKLLKLCITMNPQRRAQPSKLKGAMGIALNGIQFKPMTSGYFDPNTRRGHGREGDKDWSFDIAGAPDQRGLDSNNAHVGRVDSYHYHSLPMSLIKKQAKNSSTLIGYAADGFEIHYIGDAARSSYQLKRGKRPTKVNSGNYDGTYNEDYVFVEGKGNLDQCNMGQLNDKLVYFLTHNYPFVSRCLWGKASKDFVRKLGSRNHIGKRRR